MVSAERRETISMRNLKLMLAYDGTEFSGWQVQPDAATDSGHAGFRDGRLTGRKSIAARLGTNRCRRTCVGAGGELFPSQSPIPAENLVTALNGILPPAIRVLTAEETPAEFHARKSAQVAKLIATGCIARDICPPFLARYVWHYPYPLNEDAMQTSRWVGGGRT